MDKIALAWAGGFFSGEGYTGLSKFTTTGKNGKRRARWKRYPVMNICQAGSDETLHRFNEAIGNIGTVRGPYGPYSNNKQPYYQWQLTGVEGVRTAINALWPFLSTAKKEQAALVMEKYEEQYENSTP